MIYLIAQSALDAYDTLLLAYNCDCSVTEYYSTVTDFAKFFG